MNFSIVNTGLAYLATGEVGRQFVWRRVAEEGGREGERGEAAEQRQLLQGQVGVLAHLPKSTTRHT